MAMAAALLTGCSKEADKAPTQPLSAAPAPVAQPTEAARKMGDKSKPLTEYVELNSGRQLLALFVGQHKMTADDWARAASTSSKIAGEQDAFKRQDMIKQFQTAAEAEASTAAGKQYVYFDLPDLMPRDPTFTGGHLGEYDFNQKGFPVPFFAGTKTRDPMSGQYRSNNSKLGFSDDRSIDMDFENGDQFGLLKVQDEALARSIEAGRKKGNLIDGVMYRPDLRVRAFVFVNGTSDTPQGTFVTGQVMRIQLRDKQGNVVAEL
jgi:hypothetical protein